MRISEGVLKGRFAKPYNYEMFGDGEEVIVFTREEFNRTYRSMKEQINYINKKEALLETGDDWKLLGYWPQISERIRILDTNIDSIFEEEPLQSYLDTYLFNEIEKTKEKIVISQRGASIKTQLQI